MIAIDNYLNPSFKNKRYGGWILTLKIRLSIRGSELRLA